MLTRLETENDQSKYCLAHKISVLNASVNSSKKNSAMRSFNSSIVPTMAHSICQFVHKKPLIPREFSQGVGVRTVLEMTDA